MKINRNVQYAAVALVDIAYNINKETKAVRLKDVAERQNISISFLEQLARKMRKAGLIESLRGPGGGYKLTKSLDEVNLYDLFQAVGEKTEFTYWIGEEEYGKRVPVTEEQKTVVAVFENMEKILKTVLVETFVTSSPSNVKKLSA